MIILFYYSDMNNKKNEAQKGHRQQCNSKVGPVYAGCFECFMVPVKAGDEENVLGKGRA